MGAQDRSRRDNLLPPNPRNDAAAILHATSGKREPPGHNDPFPRLQSKPPKHRGLTAAILAVATIPITLFGQDLTIFLTATIGLIASSAALFSAVSTARRGLALRKLGVPLVLGRHLKFAALTSLLLVFNGWACFETSARWRDIDRWIGTTSQLRAIAQAVEEYRTKHGSGPANLDALVKFAPDYARCLLLPTDPQGWRDYGTPRFIPSVIYLPEASERDAPPRSILAYERAPWSIARMRLFPQYVHSVVRADGYVDKLTSTELAIELQNQAITQPLH